MNEDYTIVDGKRVANPSFLLKRILSKYSQLRGPLEVSKLKQVYNQLESLNVLNKTLIAVDYPKDMFRYALLSLILLNKSYDESLKVFNGYELLDIYLGHSEEYQSVLEIGSDIVCVYLGHGEFPNRQQGNVIVQLMESYRVANHKFWFLYKGSDLNSKYPEIHSYLQDYGVAVKHIAPFKVVVKEELI